MKTLIVLAILMAVILVVAVLAHAQGPANDLKPTFMNPTPTPGLYVNGWPAFTVSYPKEWVETPTFPGLVFVAGLPRPDVAPGAYLPSLKITVNSQGSFPLEDWAKVYMPNWVNMFSDIKVLSDKPSQLKDGSPAREVEWEGVPTNDPTLGSTKNGRKINDFMLMTKKGLAWISIELAYSEKIGEDAKRIAYSLIFLPGREEPVNVPPDIRAFLDMCCTDIVSHDVKLIMEHFSDRFSWNGLHKAYFEEWYRNFPVSPIRLGIISQEATVTVFEPHGDKAYLDGFFLRKVKGDVDALKSPMLFQQIINEHGEWKWFGNQK